MPDPAAMRDSAGQAASFLKLLAAEQRLLLLCMLLEKPLSVGALADALDQNQPNVSQHLAKLRTAGLVEADRDGTTLNYRIVDPTVRRIIATLYDRFCT